MTKRIGLLAIIVMSIFAAGCSGITAELIDKLGEPDQIYHSGIDHLTGNYEIQPKVGSGDQPAAMSLKMDEKGWKISQGDSPSLHLYEKSPEEMQKLFGHFDSNTMQCAGVASSLMCKAPAGTTINTGKVKTVMSTGYIFILDKDYDHVLKK